MDTTTLRNRFRRQFGTSGDLYFSPGRINLIGEHTDYNGGFVFPGAVDKGVTIEIYRNGSRKVCLLALDQKEHPYVEFTLDDTSKPEEHWACYVFGVCKELEKRGVRYADAPVSGGEPKAISGELSIMVGAAEGDFNTLFPVLMAMGKQITHMGKVGAGNATKLANQIITNVNIGAIAEAVNLAGKAGITPEKLFEAIRNGAAGSAMMNTRAEKIVQRNYKPGAKISINKKDLGNVLEFARSEGLELPLAGAYYQTLCRLSDKGLDGLDVSAVPEYYFDN
jgi:hypothetical protein